MLRCRVRVFAVLGSALLLVFPWLSACDSSDDDGSNRAADAGRDGQGEAGSVGGSAGSGGSADGSAGSAGSVGGVGGSAGSDAGTDAVAFQLEIDAAHDPSRIVPTWGALRDANGWRQLSVDPTGEWSEPVAGADYDVVLGCADGDDPDVFYFAGTTAEIAKVSVACRARKDDTPLTVTGQVSNLPAAAFNVRMGRSTASGSSLAPTYTLQGLPGTYDAFVVSQTAGAAATTHILIQPGTTVSSTSLVQDFDFSGVDPAVTRTATVSGAIVVGALYWSESGGLLDLSGGNGGVVYPEPGVNQRRAGDRTVVLGERINMAGPGRAVIIEVKAPGTDTSLNAPAPVLGATLTASTSAASGLTASWPADANAAVFVGTLFDGGTGSGTRSWTLGVTPGRAGAAPAFQSDDITGVAGYDAALDVPGADAAVRVGAVRARAGTNGAAPDAADAFLLFASGLADGAFGFSQMPPVPEGVYEYLPAPSAD